MRVKTDILLLTISLTGIIAAAFVLSASSGYILALASAVTIVSIITWRLVNKVHSSYTKTHMQIVEQLNELDKSDHAGMVMVNTINEIAGLVSAINNHLTKEHNKSNTKTHEIRELKICRDTAEVELRHLKSVIFSIAEGVMISDQKGNLVLANRKAQDIFDFIFDNNGPEPIEDVISNKDIISLVSESNYKNNAYIELSRQVEFKSNDGTKKSYKLVCWPVYDALDSRIGQVIVSYDITTEHEIQLMKDDIISSISHELKTPLAAIRAYAEIVAQGEYDEDNSPESMAAIIENQARRLAGMIDDILYLSRIENGAVMLMPQSFNINRLVDEAMMTIRPIAREHNIELITEYTNEDIDCFGDNELLYHALINLVTNAIKYSNPGGKVSIKSSENDKMVVIQITDNGIGIPQKHLSRIFDKFYRVPGSTNIKGTGLGLNLTKRVVEEIHKGFITVASEEGQGSVFTISLPKSQLAAEQAAAV